MATIVSRAGEIDTMPSRKLAGRKFLAICIAFGEARHGRERGALLPDGPHRHALFIVEDPFPWVRDRRSPRPTHFAHSESFSDRETYNI